MEHLNATCSQGMHPGLQKDDSGRKRYWQVDEYSSEGIRKGGWIIDGVLKHHRQLSSILHCLVDNGYESERVLEPYAKEEKRQDRTNAFTGHTIASR